MEEHWQVHYEPNLWWAQNGGIFVHADTAQDLIRECADVVACIKDWDDDLAYAVEAESMMADGADD